ncbi:MAG: hypothetical protein ACYC5N_06495 [Endomicrobiales bacterium]
MPETRLFNLREFLEHWDDSSLSHHLNLLRRHFERFDANRENNALWEKARRTLPENQHLADLPLFASPEGGPEEEKNERRPAEEILMEKALKHLSRLVLFPATPEAKADAGFSAFIGCMSAFLAGTPMNERTVSLLVSAHLAYAGYYQNKMKEYNNLAEKMARSAENGHRLFADEIAGSLRKAAERGHRALSVLSRVDSEVPSREHLYAAFEESVRERFDIDEDVLLEVSADGRSARVRVDRRREIAKMILTELCRSYARLGAYDMAGRCEHKLKALPLGYRLKGRYSLADMEEGIWKDIIGGAALPDGVLQPQER